MRAWRLPPPLPQPPPPLLPPPPPAPTPPRAAPRLPAVPPAARPRHAAPQSPRPSRHTVPASPATFAPPSLCLGPSFALLRSTFARPSLHLAALPSLYFALPSLSLALPSLYLALPSLYLRSASLYRCSTFSPRSLCRCSTFALPSFYLRSRPFAARAQQAPRPCAARARWILRARRMLHLGRRWFVSPMPCKRAFPTSHSDNGLTQACQESFRSSTWRRQAPPGAATVLWQSRRRQAPPGRSDSAAPAYIAVPGNRLSDCAAEVAPFLDARAVARARCSCRPLRALPFTPPPPPPPSPSASSSTSSYLRGPHDC